VYPFCNRQNLTEPQKALITQYVELIKTEKVQLSFARQAIEKIAAAAAKINERMEDIGARRLYTIMWRGSIHSTL
jgi:ATP-dependent HslUV protease ATP-binding subunit HslU